MFSIGDYIITPAAAAGYLLMRVDHAGEGVQPACLAECETWDEASRRARLLALGHGVRAWGRYDQAKRYVELVMANHPDAPWPAPWFPFDVTRIEREAPRGPGMYVLGAGRPLFIGETDDLHRRLLYHLTEPLRCLNGTPGVLFSCSEAPATVERSFLLDRLIRTWRPPCNVNP